MKAKIKLLREEAKMPVRAHAEDAGLDFFFCPEDGKAVEIKPSGNGVMATGVSIEVPEGHMLEIKNKSGIASKRQLVVGACVVDPGYDGEIYVNLHNIGVETQIIKSGDKIAQAVLVPVVHCGIEEATEDNLNGGSTRGDGGFGSTGDR